MKSLIPAAILLFCSILGLAQAPSPSTTAQEITLNGQTRREVIETALSALNKNYVFPETAKKMETAIRRRMDRDEYDRITDPRQFAQMLEEHLQEVSRDKHLLIFYRRSRLPSINADTGLPLEEQSRRMAELKRDNYGFVKVEHLEGNIGYLNLRLFIQPVAAGETAAAAMNFLHNTDALIIDLRQNTGGSPAMVALLCSYFFEKRIHLHDHFGMLTPVGRAINPITKTNWEGVGVQPDLAAPASDALRVAHAAAVRSVIEQTADQARKQELQDLLMELEVPTKPAPTDSGGLRLPKTPAGDAMRSFLLALNSGDIGRLRHFHRTQGANVSFGRRDFESIFQPSGGLKTRSIVTSSDYRIEVLAQFKKENTWKKLSVEVETIAPHWVKRIRIDNAELPAKRLSRYATSKPH